VTAEDATDLLTEVLTDSRRKTSCSVCDWLKGQPNLEEWDDLMALPWQEANSRAIYRAMAKRGYQRGDKIVDDHRKKGHRVSA
jgi:hypothetical protein